MCVGIYMIMGFKTSHAKKEGTYYLVMFTLGSSYQYHTLSFMIAPSIPELLKSRFSDKTLLFVT